MLREGCKHLFVIYFGCRAEVLTLQHAYLRQPQTVVEAFVQDLRCMLRIKIIILQNARTLFFLYRCEAMSVLKLLDHVWLVE